MMPTGLEIDGAGGLHRIDVLGPDVDDIRLAQLQDAHLRHFPEHAHVADEMAAAFAGGSFDPEVVVQVGPEVMPGAARVAGPAERERLWARMTAISPGYEDAAAKAGRQIPVVVISTQ